MDEARFLGLIFDRKLTWVPHFKALKVKCMDALNLLKVLAHTSWGADRKTLLKLYKALVFSKLTYGGEIYSSATLSRLKMLDSIHHTGIRLATGAYKTSSILSLLVDAGELPLDLYRQSSMLKYWFRLQRLTESLAFKTVNNESHFNYYEVHPNSPHPFGFRVKQLVQSLNIGSDQVLPFKIPITPPWNLPQVKFCNYFIGFKNNMTDVEAFSIFMEHVSEHTGSDLIFTNGSKSNAGVGFGIYSREFCRKGAVPPLASTQSSMEF